MQPIVTICDDKKTKSTKYEIEIASSQMIQIALENTKKKYYDIKNISIDLTEFGKLFQHELIQLLKATD